MSCIKRKCLSCGRIQKTFWNKGDKHQEITVCPRCNGAFVDLFYLEKYIGGVDHVTDEDQTSLLVIELEDIKSNPIVKYKGEKLKFLQEVNLSWGTSDEKGISDLELLIKRYAMGFKTETIKIETDTDV